MHKKVQLLVLAGVITANTLTPIGSVFANEIELENVLTEEATKLDKWEYSEETKEDIEVENIKRDNEGWITATSFPELDALWDCTFDEANQTIILNGFKDIRNQINGDIKVEIPRSVGGYKIALADLKSDMFPGVTHIRVAEGNEEQVKLIAINLSNGFKGNDTLKYVNFEGLDVSKVDDMYGLFSFCSNLRVINISNWVIKDSTNITAMFYARIAATDAEKKILVISNDSRISTYDYIASNRIPCIVLFSGEGGHFLGYEDILNMVAARFTIRPELLDNLDEVIKSDLIFARKPVREGFEFKGWYTDDPTPKNFYELLNMTYKARWEEIVEEDTPSEDTVQDIEVENKVDKTHVLKVNTKQGLDKVIEWLDSNMSYDREEHVIVDRDTNTTTYKINVFHHDKTVSYVDIKVSSDNSELIEILDRIDVALPPVEESPEEGGDNVAPPVEELPEENKPVVPPVEDDNTDNDGDSNKPPVEESPEEGGDNITPPADELPEGDKDNGEKTPSFTHDVLELVGGDGQQDNPFEFIVKSNDINEFKEFLNELKSENIKTVSITEDENYIMYKIKITGMYRSNERFATIKVEKSNTNITNAFNDFFKDNDNTNTDNFDPVLDGTHMDNMVVKPEVETNNNVVNPGVNNSTSNNNNLNSGSNNTTTDNPKTGDVSFAGYFGLGLTSMLAIFKNRRKRK